MAALYYHACILCKGFKWNHRYLVLKMNLFTVLVLSLVLDVVVVILHQYIIHFISPYPLATSVSFHLLGLGF